MPFPLPAGARFLPIPDELRDALAPAHIALFEWTDYFFHWHKADALEVGGRRIKPIAEGVFRVRWENALGLASLTPIRDGQPMEAPLWVEVLSPKFPSPALHVAFLRGLLARLFELSPHLIWHGKGATKRGAEGSTRAMSAPETLEWALRWDAELEQTLAAISRQPARDWVGEPVDVSPAFVSELGASQLATLASDGARWQRTTGAAPGAGLGASLGVVPGASLGVVPGASLGAVPGASLGVVPGANLGAVPGANLGAVVGGWASNWVPQTRRRQSYDNADNRGAMAFIGALESALHRARASPWFGALREEQQTRVVELHRIVSGWQAQWPEPIGAPRGVWQPRAAPYRALWQLERSFRGAGAPLWAGAARLASVRDVATLWELRVFFDLIHCIESVRGARAELEMNWDEERGLLAPSRAIWNEYILTFNGPAPSYSTPLRPDYLWSRGAEAVAAFDAKFRFEAQMGSGRGADLHKMHAYRDALSVSAAIALHPGTQTTWFDRERGPLGRVPLPAILAGEAAGVGLWGLG